MNNIKLVHPGLMWLIVIIGVALSLFFVSSQRLFAVSLLNFIILVALLAYWLYFFITAFAAHRQAAFGANQIARLITSGTYSIVRHPMYMADIVLAWGFFIAWPSWRVLFAVIWLTLVLVFWMDLEEKAMIARFGDEYRQYMKEVPKVIPGMNFGRKKNDN